MPAVGADEGAASRLEARGCCKTLSAAGYGFVHYIKRVLEGLCVEREIEGVVEGQSRIAFAFSRYGELLSMTSITFTKLVKEDHQTHCSLHSPFIHLRCNCPIESLELPRDIRVGDRPFMRPNVRPASIVILTRTLSRSLESIPKAASA